MNLVKILQGSSIVARMIICEARSLTFAYAKQVGEFSYPDFALAAGKATLVTGRSGIGKTTLLSLVGGILSPKAGQLYCKGAVYPKRSKDLRLFRSRNVGYIMQQPVFIPSIRVDENLQLAAWAKGISISERQVTELLDRVGLRSFAKSSPLELSGGELQRLAICRATIGDPPLLLADEPTSNLDDHHAALSMDLLVQGIHVAKSTLLVVSHDHRIEHRFDQIIRL